MNLVLVGLPMCGKSTVGKMLAERMGFGFIDTDRLIEEAYQDKTQKAFSCREIFKHEGESFFRNLEKLQIASLGNCKNAIISIGGGAFIDAYNVEILKKIGSIVYIEVSVKELFKRVNKDDLPAYLSGKNRIGSFERLASKRRPLYEAAADVKIVGDHVSPMVIVETIMKIKDKGH